MGVGPCWSSSLSPQGHTEVGARALVPGAGQEPRGLKQNPWFVLQGKFWFVLS